MKTTLSENAPDSLIIAVSTGRQIAHVKQPNGSHRLEPLTGKYGVSELESAECMAFLNAGTIPPPYTGKLLLEGNGFEVGQDFSRATKDTPITLAIGEHARPGHVIGYIDADPSSKLGFLRNGAQAGPTWGKVRVHVRMVAIGDAMSAEDTARYANTRAGQAERRVHQLNGDTDEADHLAAMHGCESEARAEGYDPTEGMRAPYRPRPYDQPYMA